MLPVGRLDGPGVCGEAQNDILQAKKDSLTKHRLKQVDAQILADDSSCIQSFLNDQGSDSRNH